MIGQGSWLRCCSVQLASIIQCWTYLDRCDCRPDLVGIHWDKCISTIRWPTCCRCTGSRGYCQDKGLNTYTFVHYKYSCIPTITGKRNLSVNELSDELKTKINQDNDSLNIYRCEDRRGWLECTPDSTQMSSYCRFVAARSTVYGWNMVFNQRQIV